MIIEAVAHPNIALVKYWGKRDTALNLPAAGSLSITLDKLRTRTLIELGPAGAADVFSLDGVPVEDRRVLATVDRFRALSGRSESVRVTSDNNFPTAAGLASSASGFAALVTALAAALAPELTLAERSVLARLGSGSAARSVHGGFAEMAEGERDDGSDAFASPVLPPDAWPLEVVVAVTSEARKKAGSTRGMEDSRLTSPFYGAWVESTRADLAPAREAVRARDFDRLAAIAEHSALKMHATMMATRPALIYWKPATLAVMAAVRDLQEGGVPVFYTMDAGPQVKAVCAPGKGEQVEAALRAVPGVVRTLRVGLGPGARVVSP
ncbi:MAG: diphosphomevalonate decarboxylase [Pseudomonadota bacterium]